MANNEITNPIPARLKNVTGGHVAGAIDIIDDALGKEQSDINQERINDIEQLREDTQEDIQRVEDKVDEIGDAIQFDEDGDLVTIDGDDFSNSESSAKIPTIGAIKAGADTLGIVYDVSAKNPTAGPNNDGKFTLEYILNQNNVNTLIPTSVRKGGMSIKFVQSSDNKYVQYRLMADEWSTDTEDWALCSEDVLIENPEWVQVVTDSQDKILYGIKTDGKFYFGDGCPPQVVEYITAQLGSFNADDYADIKTFLGDLIDGDTLTTLLDAKVDKVTGKSLIDADVAENTNYIENPEWIKVTTDADGKILGGYKTDGKFYADIAPLDESSKQIYEYLRRLEFRPTSGDNIIWSDNSTGVLTVIKNAYCDEIDSFTVTHNDSGLTVTQPTVTRDSNYNVINVPYLVIS